MATREGEKALRRTADAARHPGKRTRSEAEAGRGWYAAVARTGLVAKAVSFGILGILAIKLAVGEGGKATSRQGALEAIADHPFGKILLVLLALGFAAYAIWRFVQAFAEREDDADVSGEAKKWAKRAGYVGRGLIYAGLVYTSVKILMGSQQQSQNAQTKKTTAAVFDWPAGRWLVAAAGVAIIGAGLWNLYRGITQKFEDRWRVGEMSETERKWGGRAGTAGHVARGIVFGLVGIFLVKAAIEYDPKDAIGIDGALQKLAAASYGPWLLGLIAAGVVCYGVFCLVDARYRDVSVGTGQSSGSRTKSRPAVAR
jgi:Domain of Unknown Function (DUF1206)